MADGPELLVSPDGVRDGDPAALSALTERRGAAVLAYTERVAAPGAALAAAADAFARFRGAVVLAADPLAVDPERTLLRGTRFAAAAAAPLEIPLRIRLRGGPAPCTLVPELLAARAERTLSEADGARLARHLGRCAPCRVAEARFRAGEHAYREAPDGAPAPAAAQEIMRALLAAAPRATAVNGTVDGRVDVAGPDPWPPAPAPDPIEPAPAPVAEPEPIDDDQPTYEFEALPAAAFDLAPPRRRAPAPASRPALRIVVPLLILLAVAVAALAITGVLRA